MSRRAACASFVVAGLLGLPSAARADGLNIEKMRLDPDKDGFSTSIQLSLAFNEGNVNLLDFGASGNGAYRKGRHLVFAIGSSRFASRTRNSEGEGLADLRSEDARFTDKHQIHFRYNFRVFDWLRAEAFTQVESNEFQLIQLRSKTGVGPRFTPFQNPVFATHLGLLYMLDAEFLDLESFLSAPDPNRAESVVHRASAYLTLAYDGDRFAAQTTTYVQPRFDRFRDVRVLHETEFEVKILDHLSYKVLLGADFDREPPTFCADPEPTGCPASEVVRIRQRDLTLRNALSFAF